MVFSWWVILEDLETPKNAQKDWQYVCTLYFPINSSGSILEKGPFFGNKVFKNQIG